MPYNVELCYGYFEGECGIYHAFRLVAPEKDFPDDVEKSLAESLETKADNPNFIWDCMHLNLPDAVVERIKADGVLTPNIPLRMYLLTIIQRNC